MGDAPVESSEAPHDASGSWDEMIPENETDEDIVSHLYMSEAYYFNPKILKRHQVSSIT